MSSAANGLVCTCSATTLANQAMTVDRSRCPVHGRDGSSAAQRRDGRWKRRAWRTFYGFLLVNSLLTAVAHYPNLRFHGFWGPLPWPLYLAFAALWAFLWWEAGRAR